MRPPELLVGAPRRRASRFLCCGALHLRGGSLVRNGWWVMHTEQVHSFLCPAFLFFCRYRSGKATISVWVDRQRPLLWVLRFDIDSYGSILLSPVKPPTNLRLKTQADQIVEGSADCAIGVRERGP
jgi:hypothetical protein